MAKTSSTKKPANGTEKMSSGVKIIDGAQMPLDEASVRMVMEGWSIKRRMEDDKSRLDAINASLMAAHGTGCSLVVSGVCRASLAERRTLKISDYERLGSVLGERLTDLVHEKVHWTPTDKLVEMAVDADNPLQPAISACISISESASVTWRPER